MPPIRGYEIEIELCLTQGKGLDDSPEVYGAQEIDRHDQHKCRC